MSLADIDAQSLLSIRQAVGNSSLRRAPNHHRRRATATPNRNATNSEPRGASRAMLLKMLDGIPGFRPASIAPLTRWTVPSRLRRLPRRWISVLERDPSLRGRKGSAGCHHSRFNLQQTANQSKSVNCSDIAVLTVISRAVAGGAAAVSAIAPARSQCATINVDRAVCPPPSARWTASRRRKIFAAVSHKPLWRS